MGSVERLLAQMALQRSRWVELGDGLAVAMLRPLEVDLPGLAGGVRVEHVVQYAHNWRGFTEAVLLGKAVGGSDAVAFHADLWAAWVRDHIDAIPPVAQALADAVTAHLAAREAAAKNSPTSST